MAVMSRVILRAGPLNEEKFFKKHYVFNHLLEDILDAVIQPGRQTRQDLEVEGFATENKARYRPNVIRSQPISFDQDNGLDVDAKTLEAYDRLN